MDFVTKKKAALDYFVQHLLESKVITQIAKIVLFGSVAKGSAKKHSDVDILVLGTNGLDKLSDLCAETQLETYARYQESVEPLVYSLEDLRTPNYFLYRAAHYGKEVYTMKKEELKRSEARNYLSLSEEYLEGAQMALKAKSFRIAVDAAYNAAELCAKGLLLFELEEVPGSHGGIIGEFGRLYVKRDKAPKELGRRLNRGLETRNKARYDFNAEINREKAKELIKLAEEMQALLGKKLGI